VLERHEVETFLTLAEELHFGRSAERLHLSGARVSQIIAKLERRVGAPLFDRTSRRVELTALGRQLHDDLRPAWQAVTAALTRAIETGRGVTGTLQACFTGAAGGQLLMGIAELFGRHHPDCEVRIREAQLGELLPWLRDGTVDLALAMVPVDEPGIVSGPVLVSEARFLAVPVGHPFTARDAVSVEDLAETTVLPLPEAGTLQEMLTLVGAGRGVFPVGAHVRRYSVRPDVAYVHLHDAPPVQWGLLWRAGSATARVHAFNDAAVELLADL
jgi:DNA-binding transcriptional LysR family regulator